MSNRTMLLKIKNLKVKNYNCKQQICCRNLVFKWNKCFKHQHSVIFSGKNLFCRTNFIFSQSSAWFDSDYVSSYLVYMMEISLEVTFYYQFTSASIADRITYNCLLVWLIFFFTCIINLWKIFWDFLLLHLSVVIILLEFCYKVKCSGLALIKNLALSILNIISWLFLSQAVSKDLSTEQKTKKFKQDQKPKVVSSAKSCCWLSVNIHIVSFSLNSQPPLFFDFKYFHFQVKTR